MTCPEYCPIRHPVWKFVQILGNMLSLQLVLHIEVQIEWIVESR
jgi:hypothetical protein